MNAWLFVHFKVSNWNTEMIVANLLCLCVAASQALACLRLAIPPAAFASLAQGVPPPQPAPPPMEVWRSHSIIVETLPTDPAHSLLMARPNTAAESVTATWKYVPNWPSATGSKSLVQNSRTAYWPTTVTPFPGGGLIVAGMRRNGNTVIEKWTLEQLTFDVIADRIIPGNRDSVQVLYDAKIQGKDLVHNIANYPGLPGPQFLVFSHDSRACWRFDTSTSSWVKLAAPVAEAGVLAVPELNKVFNGMSSMNTVQHGYLFHLREGLSDMELPNTSSLGLLDHDRNGTLDSYVVFTEGVWVSMGLSDPSNYLPEY